MRAGAGGARAGTPVRQRVRRLPRHDSADDPQRDRRHRRLVLVHGRCAVLERDHPPVAGRRAGTRAPRPPRRRQLSDQCHGEAVARRRRHPHPAQDDDRDQSLEDDPVRRSVTGALQRLELFGRLVLADGPLHTLRGRSGLLCGRSGRRPQLHDEVRQPVARYCALPEPGERRRAGAQLSDLPDQPRHELSAGRGLSWIASWRRCVWKRFRSTPRCSGLPPARCRTN